MTKTIEVSDETYEKIKDQISPIAPSKITCIEDMIGKKFFFRAVTYHTIGLVKSNPFGNFLEVVDASWVPCSARFADTIKTGELDEVEPVGQAFLNLDTVVDFFPWCHALPTEQK